MSATIEHVPLEILTYIFTYLQPRHRKNCALVSRKWNNALKFPRFHETFIFQGRMKVNSEWLALFRNSYHPFRKLHFRGVQHFVIDDSFREFCTEINDIKEVTFSNCSLDDDHFIKIMQELNVVTVNLINTKLFGTKVKVEFPAVKCLRLDEAGIFTRTNLTAFLESFPGLETVYLCCNEYYSYLDWMLALNRWIPNIYLSCVFEDHLTPEGFVNQLIALDQFKIEKWNSLLDGLAPYELIPPVFAKFIGKLKETLVAFTIQDAECLSKEHFSLVNELKELEQLRLKFCCKCNLKIIEEISGLQTLRKLEIIFDAKPADKVILLEAKMNFPHLDRFTINVIPRDFNLVLDSFPNLRHLSLHCCTLELPDLQMIFRKCTKLVSFGLFKSKARLEACDEFFALQHLEYLALEESNISDEVLLKFSWHGLRELSLTYNYAVTSSGIKALARNCPNLTKLCLFRCVGVDDECISCLCENFPLLRCLILEKTGITDDGYETLKSQLKEVVFDDIDDINLIWESNNNACSAKCFNCESDEGEDS